MEVSCRGAPALVEVRVVWGHDAVLSVVHLRKGQRFVIAPDGPSHDARFVHPDASAAHALVVFRRGRGVMRVPRDGRVRALRDGVWEDVDGDVPLDDATIVALRIGDVTVVARGVSAAERLPAPRRDRPFGAALAAIFSGAVALAFHAQQHHDRDDDLLARDADRAWIDTHVALLTARAHPPTHPLPDDAPEGGTGERAAGDEGAAGLRHGPDRYRRWRNAPTRGVARSTTVPLPASGRPDGVAVRNRGIFAALGNAGSRAAFAWPALHDETRQTGAMYGSASGESFGDEGLGLLGRAWGGGGSSEVLVGLGRIRTRGHGMDDGDGQGGGSGWGSVCGCGNVGSLGHGRGSGGISVRMAREPLVCGMSPERIARGERCVEADYVGMMDPALVRRVVRANLGQVRRCYERALEQAPGAEGRVTVRWVIGSDGAVLAAGVIDDTVGVASVGACVAGAVRRWQFPHPAGDGVVTVNYPFSFSRDAE